MLLIPLLSWHLRTEKITSAVQDLALSFILDSSLPFRLKPLSLLVQTEAKGLRLDISSIVIFLTDSKGRCSEAHLLLGSSCYWQFPANATEENWMASKEADSCGASFISS